MSKIELPYINAKNLMKRWNIDLDGLFQCIHLLELPVYDNSLKEQSRFPSEIKKIYDKKGDLVHEYLTNGSLHYQLWELQSLFPDWPDIEEKTVSEMISPYYFRIEDIKHLEKKYGMTEVKGGNGLSSEDARELGRLRRERSKWDDSIKASLQIGLFCNEVSKESKKITRDMLTDKLFELGFNELPKTTIEKIWKAIPEKYRKKAGRPPKNKT